MVTVVSVRRSTVARRYTPEPVRSRRSADERHRDLLDAAARLIADGGVAAFTMEGLAAEGGVSRALAYQHFANVGEVLVELLEREWAWLEERISAGLAVASTFADKVKAATRPYFEAKVERGGSFRALLLDRPDQADVRGAMLTYYRRVIGFWVTEGEREYSIDRATAQSAAVILVGGFEAAALRHWGTDGADVEDDLGLFVEMVLGSLRQLARRRKETR